MRTSFPCVVLATVFALSALTRACLWDRDTVRDEEQGLPGMKELLAGKFEKHSRFYYESRVKRLVPVIQSQPQNLAAYDDLAVAYEKLDEHDKAIEVMLKKEAVKPDEYTTYANLGTFYLHRGDIESGIDYIKKALVVNPDAHFGREEYQLQLAKFYLAGKSDRELLKKDNFLRKDFDALLGDGFRARGYRDGDALKALGLKPNVIDGIAGILRFGTGKSAELYFVLGELLAARGGRHVAYAAYRRAIENGHPRSDFIRECMAEVKRRREDDDQWDNELIEKERADADQWVHSYQNFEDDLIRANKDPDNPTNLAVFYAKYGPRDLRIPATTLSEKMVDTLGFGPYSIESRLIEAAAAILCIVVATGWSIRRLIRGLSNRRATR